MPPLPGEERLATVYADIHYYFAKPTTRPVLHRFDKASYFYVYYNATRQSSRLEVANNPGTAEQDAFNGYLEDCRVVNSHKFPTLVTLVVNSPNPASPTSESRSHASRDPEEWRLPSADPRDQGKQKYRLHTLDIYFWTVEDAKLVTDLFKRLLDPSQLDIVEAKNTPSQHVDDVNPVVQNLEQVAISDPSYRNGQTRNSQNQPQTQPSPMPPAPAHSHSPAASPSPVSQMSSTGRADSTRPQEPAAHYTPMAYNPAAPAAPEPIAHREKTPPQEDGEGTGLSAVASHDAPYRPGVPQSGAYTGIPPGPVPNAFGHYGSPPPPSAAGYTSPPPAGPYQPQQQQRASVSSVPSTSFAPHPTQTSSITSARHPSAASQQYDPTTVAAFSQGHPTQPVETPSTAFYGSLSGQGGQGGSQHQPLTHVQPQYPDYLSSRPQPPVGGYSDYQYHAAGQPVPGQGQGGYDVHSQVYRPTESEVKGGGHGRRPETGASGGKSSRFDKGADKVEKKLGGFMKKLEKRIG